MSMDMEQHLNKVIQLVEKHLNEFQRDMLSWQTKIMAVWNVTNVVIKVLQERGLLDEESLRKAGEELYNDHKKNMEVTKEAIRHGRKPRSVDLIQTPMEKLINSVNLGVPAKEEENNGPVS